MSEFKREGGCGSFLFKDLSHFFTPSEAMDYHVGKNNGVSLQRALSLLEEGQYSLNALTAIFAFLFTTTNKEESSF
jgi:hypothetical protein